MKFLINFSNDEYIALKKEADLLGFSVSAYIKYSALQNVLPTATSNLPELIKIMHTSLRNMSIGKTFIVSALFPVSTWRILPINTKRTLAQQLRKYVDENPTKFVRKGKTHDRTTIYKKIS